MKFIGILVVVFMLFSCGGEVTSEPIDEQASELMIDSNEVIPMTPNSETELNNVLAENDSAFTTDDDWVKPMISLCQTNFGVYINDPGEAFTNVRSEPGGAIIMKLQHGEVMQDYMLNIVLVEDGWCKFEGPILGAEEDYEVPGGIGWVHHSVIATDTRNYGSQSISLYETPDEMSTVTGTIDQEAGGLKILDACADWVLIELAYDDYYRKGWMKTAWCCGNPFTNCS